MLGISPDDLLRSGPLLLFVMAVAETAVPAGLVVPAGVALSTGALLAWQGLLSWETVLAASIAGALVGDSLGFWLGRRGSFVLNWMPGRLRGVALGAQERSRRLFQNHSLLAVTGGRLVAFVRTLMPATAGVSGISYPRFLLFDVPGVLGWAALYVALGVGAGEGILALIQGQRPGLLPLILLALVVVFAAVRLQLHRRRRGLGG